VIMKALAKEPKQRFASVKALANALEQACLPSKQVLPIVEFTPSQSSSPKIPTNQGTLQEEVGSQQSEQRVAPVQPVSQKITSIPPPPPAQSMHPYPQPMPPVARPYIQPP